MGDSTSNGSRSLNPWSLNFQKMGLELKCPLCSCTYISPQLKSECPVCKAQYFNNDLRHAPFMENLVTIYRSLEATFCANLFQRVSSESRKILEQCQTSVYTDKLRTEQSEIFRGNKSYSGQSIFSLSANKQISDPLNMNHSLEDRVGKNDNFEINIDNRSGGGGDGFNNAVSTNPAALTSQMEPGGLEERRVVENELAHSLPDTPPSFGDAKGSDDESCDRGSEHSPEKSLFKRAKNKHAEDRTKQLRHDSSCSETDGHLRGMKRHKKLNYGPSEMSMKREDRIPPVVSHSEIVVTPNSVLEHELRIAPVAEQQPAISDVSLTSKSICAFCQSCKISEQSGPMLHYANGKMVVGDEATRSKVIHVHRLCLDWAPQAYFENETVKNLKAEVARGARLKCSKCGQKGAALGCYEKSCRKSFHIPCAAEISNCRWDYENFLLLCPAHYSVKFPHEKSKSRKHTLKDHPMPSQGAPQQSIPCVGPRDGVKEWVFCGSALSTEEKVLMVKFASMCGATVTKYWKPNVTHVIAATDAEGACTRTLKVLMAILHGRWILTIGWIKACMEAMRPVDEEPYEVSLDNYGRCDGPKTGRLMVLNNAPKLFNGFKFYFSGDFALGYKEDLQNLVITAGGTVLECKELVAQSCNDHVARLRILVVYNLDSPQGCKIGEEVDILWKRLTEAQDVAVNVGCQVIGHTWLLESIAACKLQPLVS
ncbi:hypothetical protein CJ030_MR0G026021 [Morella rubra]|uniref:Uncharacterized protein n=1 Tax=Morella rubra TaxID=262757 RepID=A0A6A1UG42_9ROSI|nr:hypothetical protein CJ030_MR0G026021 [Morella rubra]